MPDANLGIVMSASRTRRQMIQRMGRILRRKRPGVAARFVIMFAKDTLEDPANRIERDGFLDEIERISEATGRLRQRAASTSSTRSSPRPVPRSFPSPSACEHGRGRRRVRAARRESHSARARRGAVSRARARATCRRSPSRGRAEALSTGREPLEIARIGSAWRISCTGCGEASPLVEFRWQVLDQTVACRC